MQNFINTADNSQWAFEPDVVATNTGGIYSFKTAAGAALNVPTTLVPYAGPTAAQQLATAQAAQTAALATAYQTAIGRPVSYTSKAGVAKTYQADSGSVANLTWMILAFQAAAATPAGFYWIALDNTQVPFTFADLQGLAAALGAQGAAAFAQLQVLKAQVAAATTVAAVLAVIWPAA